MELMTKAQEAQLLKNGQASAAAPNGSVDHKPVVKLFNPCGAATWLISELDPSDPDIAFGLCDLGFGTPEMGSVYLPEIREAKGPLGIGIERDLHFKADKTLSAYAAAARSAGRIVA